MPSRRSCGTVCEVITVRGFSLPGFAEQWNQFRAEFEARRDSLRGALSRVVGPRTSSPASPSNVRPCDALDAFLGKVAPVTVAVNASRAPWGGNVTYAVNEDGSAQLFIGGGAAFGQGGYAISGRYFGLSEGDAAAGLTSRFSASTPGLLAGLIGIGVSAAGSPGGHGGIAAGFGPSSGLSASFTLGYTGRLWGPSREGQCR